MSSPSAPPSIDGVAAGKERWAIAALAAAAFALNLNTLALGALLPFLPPDLAPEGQDRTLLAAAALAAGAAALAVGPLADRWGRKRTMVWGMGLFALASLLHCVAHSYASLLAARIASGAAVGVAYACASALVADVVPYQRRGAGMGAFTAGMFLALPVGLPLAWWLARMGAWRALFAVQAAIAVGGMLLAARHVPRSDRRAPSANPLPVLRQPAVLAALLAVMLHNGSFFTVVQLSSRWLDEEQLVPKDAQGAVWALLGLFAAAGSFVFGRLADRIGKRNFVLLTSALLVGCMLGLSRIESRTGLLAFGSALAVVASARTGPLQALISGLVPKSSLGAVMGLRAFAMQFGVFAFALAATTSGPDWFLGVLYLAAGCQMASYLAIRFGVQEGGA